MLNNKPGFRAAVLFSAGIILFRYCHPGNIFILSASLSIAAFVIFLSFFRKGKPPRDLLMILLIVLAGIMRSAYLEKELVSGEHIRDLNLIGKYVRIEGWIEDKKIYSDGNTILTVNLLSLIVDGQKTGELRGKLRIFLRDCPAGAGYGDIIRSGGILTDFRGRRNPGEADLREYYYNQGIYADFRIPDGMPVEFMESSHGNPILREVIEPVRFYLIGLLDQNHDDHELELLKAILLGERSGLDREIIQDFKDAGTMHILAVSGLHVGFVVLIFQEIFLFAGIPKMRILPVIMIVIIILYILLTGARPPVMRAGLFFILYYISVLTQKRRDRLNLLGSTAIILLLINPKDLFNPGFQLSFAAVFGILIVMNEMDGYVTEINGGRIRRLILLQYNRVKTLFFMSVGAIAGTSILTAFHFNRIVFGAVLLNLIAIPLSGIIVFLGIFELMLGSFWDLAAHFIAIIIDILIEALFVFNRLFSEFKWTGLYISHKEIILVVSGVILVLSSLILLKYRFRFRYCIILLLTIIISFTGWMFQKSEEVAEITFLDVGQGDSAIIILPDGTKWLIDVGGEFENYNAGERHILPFFRWSGIRRLDGVFISHLNSDHYGGLTEVLKVVNCDTVYLGSDFMNNKDYGGLKDILKEKNIPVRKLNAGDVIQRNATIGIKVLSPDPLLSLKNLPINETSLVLRLHYGRISFLFTGDIGSVTEEYLSAKDVLLRSTVLKTAHHGSGGSSSSEFLEKVCPDFAVINVGRFNNFGHPSPETVQRLINAGAEILRTDIHGAISFITDGEKIKLVK